MMQLSVVIPVYNAERYLRRCLDSVLAQTLRDIEVICIDDGSTDSSSSILGKYQLKDSRVRVVSQKNIGQGAARNHGIDAATGVYICFVDADDALADTDAFSSIVADMDAGGLQLLMYDAVTRFEDGGDACSVALGNYRRRYAYPSSAPGAEMFVAMNRHGEFSASPCLYLVRRDALVASGIRFAEGVLHEDDVFTLSLLLSLERVGHVNRLSYERWVHPGSTMTSASAERHLLGYLFCIGWVDDRLRERRLPRDVLHELKRCRVGYRHAARSLAAKAGLPPPVDYPFSEKLANLFRCLKDRGLVYTVGRIFAGWRRT